MPPDVFSTIYVAQPYGGMDAAMAETIAYVNRARAFMPQGAPNPFVTRFDAESAT